MLLVQNQKKQTWNTRCWNCCSSKRKQKRWRWCCKYRFNYGSSCRANGDEYDKDIALGIRYAVDNGAKVISLVLLENIFQNKEWVIDAIKYAESKDVLLVIAAGNESYDLDTTNKYPNDTYDNSPEFAKNVLIIGALSPNYGFEKWLQDFLITEKIM